MPLEINNDKNMETQLKEQTIQARAAWKMVGMLCALHNIDTNYRDAESFYSILSRKCFNEARKEIESNN
jgi:hypothetical protein